MSKTRTCTIHNNQLWAPIQSTYITYQHISHNWVHKVRNRTQSLTIVKPFQIPPKFTNHPLFYIPYRMPIKKTPNESRTKNAFREQSSARVAARVGRRPSRAGAKVQALARFWPKNEGFHPKTRVFTPILQIRPFPTKIMFIQHSYTFNYNL